MRIPFGIYEGNVEDLPPRYQEGSCHIMFDVNMGDNICCKSQMAAGGHNTTTPTPPNYSSVLSQEIVRIALTISAYNVLKVLACDIHNAYLTTKFQENTWTVAGPGFDYEQENGMFVVRALYLL